VLAAAALFEPHVDPTALTAQLVVLSATTAPPVTFEPHVDPTALAAQLVVLGVTAGAASYWWLAVVPAARRSLAKEKRAGPTKAYLEELQAAPDRPAERWVYGKWLVQLQRRQAMAQAAAAKRAAAAAAGQPDGSIDQPQQQQPLYYASSSGEEDGDAMPSFWSLDNPILATAALLAAAAAVSAVFS
jgi:glucose/arabinose dehydrogenase